MRNLMRNKISKIAISATAVLFLAGAGLGFYLKAPSNYVALDINPSIEIHTNRLSEVTGVTPVNDDAAKLLAGYQLKDKDIETVIESIVNRLILNGYLVPDQDNKILVTVDKANPTSSLMDTINSDIKSYLEEKQINVDVLQQTMSVSKEDAAAAHANHISAGKMALVNKIAANSTLTTDELSKMNLKKLVSYAVSNNISLEDVIQNYNTIVAAYSKETAGQTETTEVTDATSSASVNAEDTVKAEDTQEADDADKSEVSDSNKDTKDLEKALVKEIKKQNKAAIKIEVKGEGKGNAYGYGRGNKDLKRQNIYNSDRRDSKDDADNEAMDNDENGDEDNDKSSVYQDSDTNYENNDKYSYRNEDSEDEDDNDQGDEIENRDDNHDNQDQSYDQNDYHGDENDD